LIHYNVWIFAILYHTLQLQSLLLIYCTPSKGCITFLSKDYYRIKSIFLKRQGLRPRHIQTLPDRMLQTASEGFAVLEYEDDNVREIDGI
ncbi:TPA: hypothetical protein ACLAUU_001711, partial [Neisseria meningitidis]